MEKRPRQATQIIALKQSVNRLQALANEYVSVGAIYLTRGDLGETRCLWTKAREMFEKIGMKPEVMKVDDLLRGLGNEEGQ